MTTRRLVVTLVAVALVLAALANVAVAAPSGTPQNAPQASYTCVAYHTVRFGDTLNSISRLYGVSVQALMAANNIYNPNLIFAGQSLCIPGNTPPPPPPPPSSCGTYYTVRWGDTLSSIAARYGTTVQAIMYANNITNANFIYAGMILYIPCGNRPPAPPPPPASFPQWRGEYFNNQNLAGAPSVVRNDRAIAFNWGLGWPNSKISADYFSVRWTRTVYLNQGTYRFSVRTDDGARLFVDNVLVIDQWHPASGETYVVDVPLGTGNHVVRMEYYEETGYAYAYLTYAWVSGTGPDATPIPPITPVPPTPIPGGGTSGSAWTCTYFANQDLDDSVATVIVPELNFNWGGRSPYPGVPKNLWSMRCTSVQYMPSSGLYQFNAQVDDGVRLFVDGNAVINAWTNHAGTTQIGTANLSAGPHNVTVEYYQFGHDSLLTVWWNRK
jgi:LysM repeat protein